MLHQFFQDDPAKPAPPEAVIRARLTMAKAMCQMKHRAYDALLSYGVNYKDGSAYKDTTLLDQAEKAPLGRSVELIIEWMGRVERDIAAMIQRKLFKKVT